MLSDARKYAALLRTIQKARPDLRRSLLKLADEQLIRCLCECASNTLKGNVNLTPVERRKLVRHKKILRRIVKKGESWKTKRKVIVQSGGAFLLPLLAPILGTVLASLVK